MADHSDFLPQGGLKSSVQSTDQQQPDSHELPSLNHQSSIYPVTLDDINYTYPDGNMSSGSMNIEELLSNFVTDEEIQAYAQSPGANSSTALNTVATTATATINIDPQFPKGEINTSTRSDIFIPQTLPRQGSVMLPVPLSQKTMDEVWSEIQKFQQELEHVSTGGTVNVQKVGSVHRQKTSGTMSLEEFLAKAGVVQGKSPRPSALLKQPWEPYQNNNNTEVGSEPHGHVARPVIAVEGAGNVLAYPVPPQSSVRDAASVAVGRIPGRYQPGEVHYGGRRQNHASGDVYGQGKGKRSLPASPMSSESEGAHRLNSVNQTGMNIDGAHKRNAIVDRVVSRRQKRLIKHRESAARSRARKEAYILELEAELKKLKEDHARLKQYVCMQETMKDEKAKDRKIGMKRSWSWS